MVIGEQMRKERDKLILTRDDISGSHKFENTVNITIGMFNLDAKVEYLMAENVLFEDADDDRNYIKILKGEL